MPVIGLCKQITRLNMFTFSLWALFISLVCASVLRPPACDLEINLRVPS